MSDIVKRLEILKSYYEDELKQSNPAKPYLDDLGSSIAYFEKLLQSGYSIIPTNRPWPKNAEEARMTMSDIDAALKLK